ncbi:MAG: aldehyde dehydrogenase family protein [Spirochaetaceae bacterium]|jgi:succinate-semialdehyde dehydrogenase/glutarate-semialdehyde dehydrogenase|nr:aldehyde dehydrogenase family protein [Spirochaetaceae bacterium]
MTKSEFGACIKKARNAQKIWAALPYGQRERRLKKAGTYLAAHVEELRETVCRDTGKLPLDALAAEILPAIMALDYYRQKGRAFLAPRRIRGGNPLMFNKRSRMVYEPYGVVGIISPWNYPFAIPFSEIVMALLAGNAVVFKISSRSLRVGRALEAMFAAADLPQGLFTYVEMAGRDAGPAFIGSPGAPGPGTPGVDKLFFTGSTATGRELMTLAAPRLLPLVLELGGADAAIVRADADVDRAAAGIAWAAFSNAGQSCGGVQRIIVHQDLYEVFLEKFCALVRGLRRGIDLGPMSTLAQKQEVRRQVERCLRMGARIAAKSGEAFFQEEKTTEAPAVVLRDVKFGMPIMEEEVFGPVAGVIPAADDEEALGIANNSCYGLTASIWSRNRRRARSLAGRINAGVVMINDHLMSHGLAETPWGGFGNSGLGRSHGEPGFKEMVKARVIVDDILPGVKRDIFWYPYSEEVFTGIRAIVDMVSGKAGQRIAAIPRVLRVFFRYWKK